MALVSNTTRRKSLVTRQGKRSEGKKSLGEWCIGYMKREDGGHYSTRPERDSLYLRAEEDWNFNSKQRKNKAYQNFSKSYLNFYVSIL